MRGSLAVLVCCGIIAGCSLFEPRVEIREVKVPVAVRAEPPPELVDCTAKLLVPVFSACGPEGWSCLSPAEEARFRTFVHTLLSCDGAWRAWSLDPPE